MRVLDIGPIDKILAKAWQTKAMAEYETPVRAVKNLADPELTAAVATVRRLNDAGLQAYLAEARNAAGQALDALGAVCKGEGVPFAGDTIERNIVYEGILETAEAEGCDLIVMASHGRQGVKALILGSVAQKVLTHAKTPVLIVKG